MNQNMCTRYVTIPKFEELSGYSADAIRTKISRGVWLEDRVWKRAPDNRILIDIEGYELWAEDLAYGQSVNRVSK